MLVDPSLDDLLTKVDNKFKLVTLAMKRARQINDGQPLFEQTNAARPVSLALHEINAGTVYVKEPTEGEEDIAAAAEALRIMDVDEAIATIERAEEVEIEAAARELAAAVAETGDEDEDGDQE